MLVNPWASVSWISRAGLAFFQNPCPPFRCCQLRLRRFLAVQ